MKKPSGIVYGVEERPPAGITVLSGLQHVGLISVILVFPLLIGRAPRPASEQRLILASDDGQRKLAGYMLRRYADRVEASHRGGRSTVLFHFDH